MYYFWTALLGFLALAWVIGGARLLRGMARLPRLVDVDPLADADCPTVSILFAARDEAEKMPKSLPTLLAQDYPRYEVIAVDDRSTDGTGQILDDFAHLHTNLRIVHLTALPPGWLGKPHGLQKAYEHSSGDWLVFTDADVRFAPDVLRRALALAQEQKLDHLTMTALLDLKGFWEKTVVSYFGLGFLLTVQPWQANNPRSAYYVGVGSFQLIRRVAYEAIGTHWRLAMEVVDDMKLGKLVKQSGFRSTLGLPEDRLRIRWQDGLGNIIRGLTKNVFASLGFSVARTLANVLGFILLLSLVPFIALFLTTGLQQLLAALAVLAILVQHGISAYNGRISPLYALTHPLGALLFSYILLRSMVVTLWRGGVLWRDRFYSLEGLKRGQV